LTAPSDLASPTLKKRSTFGPSTAHVETGKWSLTSLGGGMLSASVNAGCPTLA
jgi:hypothetical protein